MNNKNLERFTRISFFIVFFWFGILKVIGISSAGELVKSLLDVTFLNFIEPQVFSIIFGLFEMFIGVVALFKKFNKLTFILLIAHLFTTFMPLYLLPSVSWKGLFVPTLVGQYIIKNLILLALGIYIFAGLSKNNRM